MDVAEYVDQDAARLDRLASLTGMKAQRIKHLCENRRQAVRYMTARRLCAASDGQITTVALAKRGKMAGEEIYSGPLGERIAAIASTGLDVAARLKAVGIRREQFNSMMLSGWIPRPGNMRKICQAFGGALLEKDFQEHANWRREKAG